jgi:hypothetical protein
VDELTTATGYVALGAAVLAVLALGFCIAFARRLRRLREGQRVLLGDSGDRDLLAHGVELDRRLGELATGVEQAVARLDERDAELATALRGAVSHVGVVRYDAMNEMSGQQSSSVALLDSHHDGVILSSILHREQARLYCKRILDGTSEQQLSPEEEEALGAALRHSGEPGPGQ